MVGITRVASLSLRDKEVVMFEAVALALLIMGICAVVGVTALIVVLVLRGEK